MKIKLDTSCFLAMQITHAMLVFKTTNLPWYLTKYGLGCSFCHFLSNFQISNSFVKSCDNSKLNLFHPFLGPFTKDVPPFFEIQVTHIFLFSDKVLIDYGSDLKKELIGTYSLY